MSNINGKFKEAVCECLGTFSEKYQLEDIKEGDDDVIAIADFNGIQGITTTPVLHVTRQKGMLVMGIRNLAYLGPENSIAHLATSDLFRDLTRMIVNEEEITPKDRLMHVLMLNAFAGQRKDVWDLMGMITMEINNFHLLTRSLVDYRDGEVYVEAVIEECDFECLPGYMEDRVQNLAGHAQHLAHVLHIIRLKISCEPASSDEQYRDFSRIQALLKTPDRGESEETHMTEDANTAGESHEGGTEETGAGVTI